MLYRNVNLVAIGAFNPAIFQPEWFRRWEILPEHEIEATEREGRPGLIVTNDAAYIHFESLTLIVSADRWQLLTEQPDWFDDLAAVAGSVFDHLPHTPIQRVGFNYVGHFEVPSPKTARERIERWLPLADLGGVVGENPRLGGTVHADWEGYRVLLSLEESLRIKGGLFINQNYERRDVRTGDELGRRLDTDWQKFLSRAKNRVEVLLEG